ncbi:MAG: (2Fe-2S)-binding protein [Pseudomonadota bacterium]
MRDAGAQQPAGFQDETTVIVCSCNIISKSEIVAVVRDFLRADPWQLITAGKVYAAMAKRGKCCGCFPGVIDIIVATAEDFHREMATHEAEIIPFISRIREEHERCQTMRTLLAERRRNAA